MPLSGIGPGAGGKLLRSYLFVPGNHPHRIERALGAGADAIVLDLEDAVPESQKVAGRGQVAAALSEWRRPSEAKGGFPAVYVRVNDLSSVHWREDVDAVIGPGLRGLRVPKAESLEALCRLHDAVSERERIAGLTPGTVEVVATIESARGAASLDVIARAPRLAGFTFGAIDFCADVGADPADPASTSHVRSAMVVTSRSFRLAPPVASVYTRVEDDEGLRADTASQKRLGFFGRSAIHPRQVPIIHAAFTPTSDEVEAATNTVAAYESASAEGRGVMKVKGAFIDLAVVRRARTVLEFRDALRSNKG